MNVIFVTAIVFTVALVHGEQEELSSGNQPTTDDLEDPHFMIRPCQAQSSVARYQDFVDKHILTQSLNTLKDWERWKFKSIISS